MQTTEMTTPTYYYYYYYDTSIADSSELQGKKENLSHGQTTLAIVYSLMFVFSLCANGLVLLIIYLFEKLNSVTNLLLLNLVLSSLLFISSLPFQIDYLQRSQWVFGGVMCKIVGSLFYLGVYSSVLFLALLTFDRHLAVVYSIRAARMRNRGYALCSCAAVWIISALACIKPMILHQYSTRWPEGKTHCQENTEDVIDFIDAPLLRSAGFYIQLLLFFLFPLLLIVYCYTRITFTVLSSQIVTRFKTVRLIFVIVLLFFICWTPFNITLLMYEKASREERAQWRRVLKVTEQFAYIYFGISPVFYTFVGKKFQNYFRMLLVKRFPKLQNYISVSQVSRTNMSTRSTPNEL